MLRSKDRDSPPENNENYAMARYDANFFTQQNYDETPN